MFFFLAIYVVVIVLGIMALVLNALRFSIGRARADGILNDVDIMKTRDAALQSRTASFVFNAHPFIILAVILSFLYSYLLLIIVILAIIPLFTYWRDTILPMSGYGWHPGEIGYNHRKAETADTHRIGKAGTSLHNLKIDWVDDSGGRHVPASGDKQVDRKRSTHGELGNRQTQKLGYDALREFYAWRLKVEDHVCLASCICSSLHLCYSHPQFCSLVFGAWFV